MIFRHRIGSDDPPLYSTNYPLRVFVSLRAIVVGCIAIFETNTVSHALLVTTGMPGLLAMIVLVVMGVMGIIDAVINDVLPARYVLMFMARHRHLGFIALAAVEVGLMLIIVARGYFGTALLALALDATAAIWIAIYHVRHRYVVPRAKEREDREQWEARFGR